MQQVCKLQKNQNNQLVVLEYVRIHIKATIIYCDLEKIKGKILKFHINNTSCF